MRRLWLDLGITGSMTGTAIKVEGSQYYWHDHGLGLLRTIMRDAGVESDVLSVRSVRKKQDLYQALVGYDMLLMNVRSYRFEEALEWSSTFKTINPQSVVLVGGLHVSMAPDAFLAHPDFDKICRGHGENIIVKATTDPDSFPRLFEGIPLTNYDAIPFIDRTLWPVPPAGSPQLRVAPLELTCGIPTPGPIATVITSRLCPWRCSFCNEAAVVPNAPRRSVDSVIDEINWIDETYGPIGTVVMHDSMFFQNPPWLKEWVEKYPRRARKLWPYWAAARADTICKWPDLFEALLRETNWRAISVGFESGSDRVLEILNKECTVADNAGAIDLLTRIGDDMIREGKPAPFFWANIIYAIPGETRKDAIRTAAMLKYMQRKVPSISYFEPTPGTALGHQLIVEGKSHKKMDDWERQSFTVKLDGVDYPFYAALLAGKYDREVAAEQWP